MFRSTQIYDVIQCLQLKAKIQRFVDYSTQNHFFIYFIIGILSTALPILTSFTTIPTSRKSFFISGWFCHVVCWQFRLAFGYFLPLFNGKIIEKPQIQETAKWIFLYNIRTFENIALKQKIRSEKIPSDRTWPCWRQDPTLKPSRSREMVDLTGHRCRWIISRQPLQAA